MTRSAPSSRHRSSLLRGTRGAGHHCAVRLAQLDREAAHPARPAVHQVHLARVEMGLLVDGALDGARRLRQARGVRQRDAVRDRQQLPLRHGHFLRVPAAAEQRAHLVPQLPAGDFVAKRGDPAGAFQPGVVRRARWRRVAALALHQVGPVHPGGGDIDDHLVRSRHRVGDLLPAEHAGPSRLSDHCGTHRFSFRQRGEYAVAGDHFLIALMPCARYGPPSLLSRGRGRRRRP